MSALALAALLLSGCAGAPAPAPAAVPSEAAPPPSPSAEVPDVPQSDASLASPAAVIAPVRLAIPDLSIDMRVDAEGLDAEGAMALPVDAADAGWYKFGPGIGADAGATVVAAHVDSYHDGIGPFSRLKDVAVGATVTLTGDDGSVIDYSVTEVRSVGKIDAPMAELFDRSGDHRLTLVTCGGVFDSSTGHYLDNIVVTATPVAAR